MIELLFGKKEFKLPTNLRGFDHRLFQKEEKGDPTDCTRLKISFLSSSNVILSSL